jgi:hypothetical protein
MFFFFKNCDGPIKVAPLGKTKTKNKTLHKATIDNIVRLIMSISRSIPMAENAQFLWEVGRE